MSRSESPRILIRLTAFFIGFGSNLDMQDPTSSFVILRFGALVVQELICFCALFFIHVTLVYSLYMLSSLQSYILQYCMMNRFLMEINHIWMHVNNVKIKMKRRLQWWKSAGKVILMNEYHQNRYRLNISFS